MPEETYIPEARNTRASRVMGGTLLALLFVASSSFVLAYLSETPGADASGELAAAATTTPDPFAGISIEATSAYVEDLASGRVLYEKNADVQLPLASLTKIATVLAASEVLSPDTLVTLRTNISAPSSPEYLPAGKTYRIRDLLDFTLMVSSNDGAEFLASLADPALHTIYSGSPAVGATLWRMNDIVAKLGLRDTYFLNASGLDVSETQSGAYGSARGVAALLAYALREEQGTFEATARERMTFTATDGTPTLAHNTDDALGEIPGLIMGKTGYTDLAGGNLAVVFNVGLSHPVAVVVLGSSYDGRFDDMRLLVDTARRAVAGE